MSLVDFHAEFGWEDGCWGLISVIDDEVVLVFFGI